jgi:hypothetical protein
MYINCKAGRVSELSFKPGSNYLLSQRHMDQVFELETSRSAFPLFLNAR